MMRLVRVCAAALAASAAVAAAPAQESAVLALAGGTLIDGYGGRPLRNSVVLVEGERIKAVGQIGVLEIPRGGNPSMSRGREARSCLRSR